MTIGQFNGTPSRLHAQTLRGRRVITASVRPSRDGPRPDAKSAAASKSSFSPLNFLSGKFGTGNEVYFADKYAKKEYLTMCDASVEACTQAQEARDATTTHEIPIGEQQADLKVLLEQLREASAASAEAGHGECMAVATESLPRSLQRPLVFTAPGERGLSGALSESEDEEPSTSAHTYAPLVTAPGTHMAYGTSHEILLQGFNWESHKSDWYKKLREEANMYADFGFTIVWMPPPTASVSREGYMPTDYYNLNSNYGGVDELKSTVKALHAAGLKVAGDAVLNHRCALKQNDKGIWNQFGGTLDWDASAIVGDDPHFHGKGSNSTGDNFHAAPNVDHSQKFVRDDISNWLIWMRNEIGFDSWRLDFVRGFGGEFVKEYCERSGPSFVVGEYWDSLKYKDGTVDYDQDEHRQRIINWLNAAGGLATAFDVTTKGILHDAFGRGEYWRLRDSKGKPPGVMGWWPSRTTTFLENHDTGSTQGHWRFPHHSLEQGYCYILTHPGTPTVFYDHIWEKGVKEAIRSLIKIRKDLGIHCKSSVEILKAEQNLYCANINGQLIMKIGHADWGPGDGWNRAANGKDWCVWLPSE